MAGDPRGRGANRDEATPDERARRRRGISGDRGAPIPPPANPSDNADRTARRRRGVRGRGGNAVDRGTNTPRDPNDTPHRERRYIRTPGGDRPRDPGSRRGGDPDDGDNPDDNERNERRQRRQRGVGGQGFGANRNPDRPRRDRVNPIPRQGGGGRQNPPPPRADRPGANADDEDDNLPAVGGARARRLARQGRDDAAPDDAAAGAMPADGAAIPQLPDNFNDRLAQLQRNLDAIQPPQVPAAAATPATPDAQQPGQPDTPAQPGQAAAPPDQPPTPAPDVWEVREQVAPHPEYFQLLQRIMAQLQGQLINQPPSPALQNAINRVLHARDRYLTSQCGWDNQQARFAHAGLQGPAGIGAGNAQLMRQNFWTAFEDEMDHLKTELFRFIFDHKAAQFGAQRPDFQVWARNEGRQIGINCIFPVALHMYEDMERRIGASLQEQRDRNIFQRMGDWWNRQPRWARILTGAGIAAGIGALIGFFTAPAVALTYAAWRGGRALAGGALAFGLQTAVDNFFVSPHYERLRQAAHQQGRVTAEANINRLASGWEAQNLDWYNRYGNLKEMMRNIDRDALLLLQQLNQVGANQSRTRLITGVLTGLAGGFLGGALYDRFTHPELVSALPPGGTKLPETPKGDIVRTIHPGDNLWKVSRGLIADGTLTEKQWADGWQHSKVDVMSHGVEKSVPVHTVGLVHPNDQFVVHKLPDGSVRFDVLDYAKDRLHLGDNAEYARLLQSQGKPLPAWLKDALHISDTTPHAKGAGAALAHAASGVDVHHGAGHHGLTHGGGHGVGPDNIINFPRGAEHGLIVIDNPAPLLKSFPTESVADQNATMVQLDKQIAGLRTEIADPRLPAPILAHDQDLLTKALDLKQQLSGLHQQSLEGFTTALHQTLDHRHIGVKYYDSIKGLRVADFLWMTEQMHANPDLKAGGKIAILGSVLDNKDTSFEMEKFLQEFHPGRFEKKMLIEQFLRHVPPMTAKAA